MPLRIPILTFLILVLAFCVFFLLPLPSRAELPAIKAQAPNCTLGSCPTKISFKDNGKTLTYPLEGKMTVILNEELQPRAELNCSPSGVLSPLALAPSSPYPLYSSSFRIQARGTCILKSGDFSVKIIGARFR